MKTTAIDTNNDLTISQEDIPHGAFQQEPPYSTIARKWIAYAQKDMDTNDIAAAIWSAIAETRTALKAIESESSTHNEPIAKITAFDEYGPTFGWFTHWATLPVGTLLYTTPQSEQIKEVRND